MVEKLTNTRGVRLIGSETKRVIVCVPCGRVVAEDQGRPIDRALATLAANSHTNYPRTGLGGGGRHCFETVNLKTMVARPGLCFDEDYRH